jgi:hypothetical protein
MSLAGARLLARRCPAYRRSEPGLRLSCGNGRRRTRILPTLWVTCADMGVGERERPKRPKVARD